MALILLVPCSSHLYELEPHRSGNSYSLKAEAYVNDEKFGEGTLDQMDWTFGEVVSFASRGTKVMPGDAICSGYGANLLSS